VTAPLTWYTALTTWDMPVATAVVLGLAAACYAWAASRVRRWPLGASASFAAALVVAAFALGGGVNAYSGVLFSMHMVQHLLLIMVVPAFLVLGRPLELLRRTLPERGRAVAGGIARSRVVSVLTNPVLAFVFYTGVVVGTHLTPFQQNALLQPGLHVLEELLYLASGYLLLLLVLGGEPLRRTLSHLMRVVVLLAGMVVDTIVGLTLMMTPSEPFPAYGRLGRAWGPSLIDDLHLGGAIMWVGGDVLMAALAIVVITQWVNSPTSGNDLGPWLEAARRSAVGASEGTDDIDDDEDALDAYNAMLSRLANGERGDPDR